MHARRFLLLAPLALLGCQTGFEECGQYNWFLCAYNNVPNGETESDSDSPTTTQTTVSPAMCNGKIEDGEECDDNNGINTDDCVMCSVPWSCGDAFVHAMLEVCDDGEASNTDNGWEMKKTCKSCTGYADYCGDGARNGPEVCDSGADNSDTYTGKEHCNADCTAAVPFCGDGTCQAQESLMQCPSDCASVCGDGMVQAGEVCDAGIDTVECDGDCTKPSCGDKYLNKEANEECDDGNQDDTDACRKDCTNALCGDGVVQVGVEGCDDGNQTDDDECSNLCVPARRVFVTAGTYSAGTIMGVAGADMLCKTAGAGLAGPGNTWLAWISDDTSSPANRVGAANKSFTGWYLLPTGALVAKGWSGLTGGTLVNPINLTETGMMPGDPLLAWTNTNPNGTSGGASDCTNWTKSDGTTSGYGDTTSKVEAWTQAGNNNCNGALRLYCLEVSP